MRRPTLERGLALAEAGRRCGRHRGIRSGGCRSNPQLRIRARQPDCAVRTAAELGERRSALQAAFAQAAVPAEAHYNFGRVPGRAGTACGGRGRPVPQGAGGEPAARQRLDRPRHNWPRSRAAWTRPKPTTGKAAEQAPDDPLIRFNIARMLIARQQYRDAIAQLDQWPRADHPGPRPLPLWSVDGARAGRRSRRRPAVRGRGARSARRAEDRPTWPPPSSAIWRNCRSEGDCRAFGARRTAHGARRCGLTGVCGVAASISRRRTDRPPAECDTLGSDLRRRDRTERASASPMTTAPRGSTTCRR